MQCFKIKFVTALLLIVFLSCNQGYTEKNGEVYLNGEKLEGNALMLNESFVKDSTSVYFKGSTIQTANPATFVALNDHFGKDDQHVYYCDQSRDGRTYYTTSTTSINIVDDADAPSFGLVGYGYAKDARHAFFHTTPFTPGDLASFKGLDNSFASDRFTAYFNRTPIPASDGNTFRVVNGCYARDTSNYYFYDLQSSESHNIFRINCDVATMQILDYPYSIDKSSVFYRNKQIPGATPNSFSPLANDFSKDASMVYFKLQKVQGADVNSFTSYPENDTYTYGNYYAKDNGSVFWQCKKVNADVQSFTPVAPNYATDKSHVYYQAGVVSQANVKTFSAYPHDVGDADAEDSTHRFKEGRVVKDE